MASSKQPVDWHNLAERALWTGLQGVISVAVVQLADAPVWWAAPLALVLSGAKTLAADRLRAGGEDG